MPKKDFICYACELKYDRGSLGILNKDKKELCWACAYWIVNQ